MTERYDYAHPAPGWGRVQKTWRGVTGWLPPIIVREYDAEGRAQYGLGVSYLFLLAIAAFVGIGAAQIQQRLATSVHRHDVAVKLVTAACKERPSQCPANIKQAVSSSSLATFEAARRRSMQNPKATPFTNDSDFWGYPMTRSDQVRAVEFVFKHNPRMYFSSES